VLRYNLNHFLGKISSSPTKAIQSFIQRDAMQTVCCLYTGGLCQNIMKVLVWKLEITNSRTYGHRWRFLCIMKT